MTSAVPAARSSVIGVDLGGTKIAAGLVDESGAVTHRLTVPTPAKDGADAIVTAVVDLVTTVSSLSTESGDAGAVVEGVGIGAAGMIDPRTGDVVSATDALSGWAGTRLREQLTERFGLPVEAINDVHAHAIGEASAGAGLGHKTVLLVAVGTGVGGALVVDGTIQVGRHGAAGHYGHMVCPDAAGLLCSCGGIGHVEAVGSGPAIHRAYLRNGGDASVDSTPAVFARIATDVVAAESVRIAAHSVGALIGGLVNAADPDVVVVAGGVVAGGVAASGGAWWHELVASARREQLPFLRDRPIVTAALGHDSAIVGAALHLRRTAALSRTRSLCGAAILRGSKGPAA